MRLKRILKWSALALLLLAAGSIVRLIWLGVGFRRLRTYRLKSTRLGIHRLASD